ncbi:hypothetical protein BJY01DRAFT_247349 [Aspergillus pseudoustus]|uniref:LysM domain-containing protein n=1 Tax=Aspergillus pseudoustus TaxID=1810923 RepID=A0ABR4K290_9EURO
MLSACTFRVRYILVLPVFDKFPHSSCRHRATAGPPGPTQSGIPDNCNKWHLVEEGDTCWDLSQENGITLDQLYEWDPAAKNDCAEGFWLGNAYCVGIAD